MLDCGHPICYTCSNGSTRYCSYCYATKTIRLIDYANLRRLREWQSRQSTATTSNAKPTPTAAAGPPKAAPAPEKPAQNSKPTASATFAPFFKFEQHGRRLGCSICRSVDADGINMYMATCGHPVCRTCLPKAYGGWCANCGKQIQSVKSTSQDDRQRVQNWLATTALNANKATTSPSSAPTTSQVPKPEVVELKLLTEENDELNTQIEGLRKGQGTMTKQRNAEKAEFEEKIKNLTEEKKKLELRLTEQAKHLENSLKSNQQKDVELEGKNLRLTSEILELRESAVTYTRIRVKITNIPMDDTQEDVIKKWLDGGKHLIYWDESPDMFMRLLADDTQSCVAYLANEEAALELKNRFHDSDVEGRKLQFDLEILKRKVEAELKQVPKPFNDQSKPAEKVKPLGTIKKPEFDKKPAPAPSTQKAYVPREQQANASQATSKASTSTPTPPKSSTPDPKATNVLSIRGFGNEATDKEIIQLVDGSTQLFQKKDGKPRIEKYPGYHLVYMNTPIIAEKVFNRLQGRTYKWGKLQVSYHL
ncbi:unnamed protein product, partial [Mesorhabditis spiculigera]